MSEQPIREREAQILFFTGVKRVPAPNTCGMGCERFDQCKRRPKCENDNLRKEANHE